ncbi:hypothetical protein ACSMXN_13640 [Jatrophihabitans sp. DSM 45814]
MNTADFTARVRDQIEAAAALGDERTQQVATALAATTEAAVRLAILEAVSAATTEINAALFEAAGGQPFPAASVHLDGEDVRVTVTHPQYEPEDTPRTDDGEATARISLRLTEALKTEIEQAAAAADTSVNNWLVRAAISAVNGAARSGPGSGWPPGPGSWVPGQWGSGPWTGASGRSSGRVTGWVTG